MLRIVWISLLASLVAPVALRAGEGFPYLAFVIGEGTEARSGPGMGFYATGNLQRGELVEVYRHEPGGWCAIRPPSGSFSWVSSRYLKLQGDGLGEIIADGAVSIVGSQLTDAKDVWHVKLNRGEEVEVLATVRSNFGIWYKIAPPAGEFRYVPQRDLEPYAADESVQVDSPGWNNASERARMPHGPASVEKECDEIDVALSAMVCLPWQQWSFETLYDRAEGALAVARTSQERQAVKKLIARLDRFEELRHEQSLLAKASGPGGSAALSGSKDLATTKATAGNAALSAENATETRQYAGRGTLVRVDSNRRGGAPRFALLDAQGQFIAYVVPTAQVDVSRYLNQEVGVQGQRTYNADLRAPQLVAQKITALTAGGSSRTLR